jgi:murein DD-endopeptidase MepM/ murein hydrolase activator NlpD
VFRPVDTGLAGHGGAVFSAAIPAGPPAGPPAEPPIGPASVPKPALDLALDLVVTGIELPMPFAARAGHLFKRLTTPMDLAEQIGTRQWWRGMATVLGLIGVALAFWPDFSRLDAAPAVRLNAAQAEELRAQAIAPLATGGGATRRMGPGYALRTVPFVPERAEVRLTSVLAPGDSIPLMLQRAGADPVDANRASALVAATVPLDSIAAGTKVSLILGARPAPGRPRPLHFASFRARFDLALSVVRNGMALDISQQAIAVDTTPLRIRGRVGESLYRSARAVGAPPSAIQQYLQALDSHVSLEGDVHPDDQFDLVFAMKRAATGETEVGDLLYAGLDRGTTPIAQLLRWGHDGGFYAADSFTSESLVQTGSGGTGMLMPVNGHVTSAYGQRFHPILGYSRMHAGVDIGAAWGSPIIATAPGVVSFAGWHGGHGNFVRLEHGGGLGTGYGHMSRIAVGPGETVRAGEIIGYVGSTGLSTGPHLHYEMYRGGHTVNPLGTSFATVTRTVDTRDLAAFKAKLIQMRSLRVGGTLASAASRISRIAMR